MSDSPRRVLGKLGFSEPMEVRPRYHANDTSRDVLNVVPREVEIEDLRRRVAPPSLDAEGFCLFQHVSEVRDFHDREAIERVYHAEIRELLLGVTGADHVAIAGAGILRYGERSPESGAHNNSRPARFVHVDVSDGSVGKMYARTQPGDGRRVRRAALYNVWRALTPPPQDVALAVCDARSLCEEDLILADAIFDRDGGVVFTLESWLLRHNSRQRWAHYSNMHSGEALVFKTNDTDPHTAHCVPHGAFDNAECPADAPPRVSIEMRGCAFWFE